MIWGFIDLLTLPVSKDININFTLLTDWIIWPYEIFYFYIWTAILMVLSVQVERGLLRNNDLTFPLIKNEYTYTKP